MRCDPTQLPPVIRVLMIDASEEDIDLVRRMLESASTPELAYELEGQGTYESGRNALREGRHDVYLIDYSLPPGLGIDLIRELRQGGRESVPAILVTARSDFEADRAAQNCGASDLLPKEDLNEVSLERTIRYSFLRHLHGEQLRRSRDRAEEANRAKSQFLANMGHEFRTPMTAILGFAETLADPDLDHEEVLHAVGSIQQSGQRLLGLITRVLEYSRLESEGVELSAVEFEPCRFFADLGRVWGPKAQERGLDFVVEFSGVAPTRVRGDRAHLDQIFTQVLENALKFTFEGVIRLQVEWGDRRTPVLQCDVLDSGVGMRGDEGSCLFQPFTQGDSSMSRAFEGAGLGLALARRLARLMGGDVQLLHTQEGAGSCFRIYVPFEEVEGAEKVRDPQAVFEVMSRAALPGRTSLPDPVDAPLHCRVLLVEDRPMTQRLVSSILTRAGAEVEVVENGKLAIEHTLEAQDTGQPFDAVLMDMQMPVMDGYTATRTLRELDYRRPILAVTAHAMRGDREKCLQAGCDDYLVKPVDRHALVELIRAHLEVSA